MLPINMPCHQWYKLTCHAINGTNYRDSSHRNVPNLCDLKKKCLHFSLVVLLCAISINKVRCLFFLSKNTFESFFCVPAEEESHTGLEHEGE